MKHNKLIKLLLQKNILQTVTPVAISELIFQIIELWNWHQCQVNLVMHRYILWYTHLQNIVNLPCEISKILTSNKKVCLYWSIKYGFMTYWNPFGDWDSNLWLCYLVLFYVYLFCPLMPMLTLVLIQCFMVQYSKQGLVFHWAQRKGGSNLVCFSRRKSLVSGCFCSHFDDFFNPFNKSVFITDLLLCFDFVFQLV